MRTCCYTSVSMPGSPVSGAAPELKRVYWWFEMIEYGGYFIYGDENCCC